MLATASILFCRKKGLVFTKGDAHVTIKAPNREKE
jgi:hypothetical protein